MQSRDRIGSNFDKAINNEFELDSNKVLQEAWDLTKTTKQPILFGALWTFGILFLAFFLLSVVSQAAGIDSESNIMRLLQMAVNVIIVAPLVAGLTYMGIKHSVGGNTAGQDVFRFVSVPWPFILTALITSLITNLGEIFLPISIAITLLWMLVFGVSLSMAIPLVAESALKPFQAVTLSLKVVLRRWFTFFIVYLVMFILFLLALIPFGLGLIWIIPMFYNVQGVMYRQVFGVRKELADEHDNTPGGPESSGAEPRTSREHQDNDNFTA